MDVCGEPDELEASGSTEEEVIQRKVTIGSQNYTLVLRGRRYFKVIRIGHKVQSKVQVGVNVRTVEVLQQGYQIPPVDQHTGVVQRVQGIPIVHGPLPSHSCC
jgi:hypothetical protein